MKVCPTCGRAIADSVSVCESCEAWAAALVEPPADEPGERASPPEAAAASALVPVATTPPAARTAISRRQITFIAAGIAAAALTGLAMSSRGGPASGAAAAAGAPAADARTAPAAAPAPTVARPVQTWSTENQATWLGGRRRGAAFELASENVVKTWFGPARASLVVRCAAQQVEAFVVTRSPMKIVPAVDGKSVTISVDGEPARTERWTDSDDHTAVFAPDPAAFVQRLRQARTFDFGYSPHNSSDVVAQFHVSGIEGLMAAARECGSR